MAGHGRCQPLIGWLYNDGPTGALGMWCRGGIRGGGSLGAHDPPRNLRKSIRRGDSRMGSTLDMRLQYSRWKHMNSLLEYYLSTPHIIYVSLDGTSQVMVCACEAKLRANHLQDRSQTYVDLVSRVPTSLGTETHIWPRSLIQDDGMRSS